ncbi:PEP-CTERM sorting domain-containing protein [Coraliomargarita sp. W4R53]
MKNRLLFPLFIVVATSAQADVILFNDTYNVTGDSNADANFELGSDNARQAGGTTEALYTTSSSNSIIDNGYGVDGGSSSLNTNFLTGIGANDFTLSIDGKITSGTSWIAFSMVNTTTGGRGSSNISFRIHPNDIFISGPNPIQMTRTAIRDISGLSGWDASAFNTYAFVADATDALTGTYDFTINDIVVQENISYTFVDELTSNDRTLDWALPGEAAGVWDNTTLTIVPEPQTFALIGGLFALSAVALRRRK